MGNCVHHAMSSAKKFGGRWEDYYKLHLWFDESKAGMAEGRHRAMLHHSEGIFLLEECFGPVVVNSDGKSIPTRLIGEQHVKEDLGWIPSLKDWYTHISLKGWMTRGYLLDVDDGEAKKKTEEVPQGSS